MCTGFLRLRKAEVIGHVIRLGHKQNRHCVTAHTQALSTPENDKYRNSPQHKWQEKRSPQKDTDRDRVPPRTELVAESFDDDLADHHIL
jgi:hypothetical protein